MRTPAEEIAKALMGHIPEEKLSAFWLHLSREITKCLQETDGHFGTVSRSVFDAIDKR